MWRVLEWSPGEGRCAVSGPHFPRLELEPSLAGGVELEVGEGVELEFHPGTLTVARVTPLRPRFTFHRTGPAAPALRPELERLARAELRGLPVGLDLRVRLDGDRVVLAFRDAALVLAQPRYVELPLDLDVQDVFLADPAARDYLATRVELGPEDVAVAIVDDQGRFSFVVCAGLTVAWGRTGLSEP